MKENDPVGELRQATREAHEAIQGLREAERDLKSLLLLAETALKLSVQERIGKAVEEGLAEYEAELKEAIARGTQATYDRFDLLATVCLGEERMKDSRVPSLPELLRRYIASNGEAQIEAAAFLAKTRKT